MVKRVSIKIAELRKRGFESLTHWLSSSPRHIYIGRRCHYVEGAEESKWSNPYTVKKHGREGCLTLYEEHIRKDLYYDLLELHNMILGCFCLPNEECHGDILVRLYYGRKDE